MQESNVIFSPSLIFFLFPARRNPASLLRLMAGSFGLPLLFRVAPTHMLTWETFAAHCVIDGNEFVMDIKRKRSLSFSLTPRDSVNFSIGRREPVYREKKSKKQKVLLSISEMHNAHNTVRQDGF